MIFRPFRSKLWPLLAFAVVVMTSSSEAQRSATNDWQPIIFSSPDNTEISSNLLLPSTPSSPSLDFQGGLRAFQGASPGADFDSPPFPAGPGPMPNQVRRFQKSSDDRSWEFMTPAEIMGVAPGQIVQNQKSDGNSDQGSLTPMERYLIGKNPGAEFQANSSDNVSSRRNFLNNGNGQTNDILSGLFGSGLENLGSPSVFNRNWNTALNNNSFTSPNEDSSWSQLFGSPAPTPAPNQEQQEANMVQFMQLLNPGSTPATAATTAPDETTSLKAQTVLSDSDSTQPLADPIGASFVPLSSGINKPTGSAPLPSITRQASAQPVTPPSWAPQPPPWLSPTPRPFSTP